MILSSCTMMTQQNQPTKVGPNNVRVSGDVITGAIHRNGGL
jgi:hypothetical protein